MTQKKRKQYVLREGMVLEKVYHKRVYRLLVIRQGEGLKFKIDEHVFASLTAAAKYVCRDDNRSISGPLFWRAQLAPVA
jgi:hypothetical protein